MTTRTPKASNRLPRKSCGIREAKAGLSQLLREVQAGAEVVITDRGRPVGKLVPVSPEDLSLEDRLQALQDRQWIEPAGARRELPPPLPLSEPVAQRFLREDRDGMKEARGGW